ncbi:MAG: hypothetical protein KIT60_25115 [Burkholderiaceae bacterium]|nr:hypothetical protein [Burkholderiaceae bacterium]
MSDDLSHDTHLRAALRHAPDHALAPPAGVSQTILSAARRAHRPVRAPVTASPVVRVTAARPRTLDWLLRWFASPRLAGGLATALVAALSLGLWLDLGDQPVIEREPVSRSAPMRGVQEPAVPDRADVGHARDAQPAPAPAAEPPRARAKTAPGATASAGGTERKLERAERPVPPAATESARGEGPAAQHADDAVAKASPPAVATPPAAPPAPMADSATAATPAAPGENLAQRNDAALRSEQRMLSAAGRAAVAAAPDGARAMASETGTTADAAGATSPAMALLRRARGELAGGAARWSWTPPGSPLMAPFDDPGQAWLARVVQAARNRWTDVSERAGSGDAIEVRWWRDEWPQATLRLESDGLRWIEHGGRIRFAPLDAATLARLRSL